MIPGRLVKVDEDQGDLVQIDQVVARLNDHGVKYEVEIEVADVTAHKGGVERLQADIAHAKANLDFASASEEPFEPQVGYRSGTAHRV